MQQKSSSNIPQPQSSGGALRSPPQYLTSPPINTRAAKTREKLGTIAGLLVLAASAEAIDVPTSKLDNNRSGASLTETTLTPANVNATSFGKLFTRPVDGDLYPQPLIVGNLNIGGGTHDVVFLATAKNNVYAYDATVAGNTNAFWSVSLGPPVPASDVQCCCPDVSGGWIGIIGTPAIDVGSQTMYVVAKNKFADGTYHQFLHALDLTSGAEKFGGPTEIIASAAGTGAGSVNGVLTFDAKIQNQRTSLLLQNGRVYIAWSSHNDCGNYHGWVIAYDAATLARVAVFVDTPNGIRGGIWMSGGGLVGDGTNVFFDTGNGTTDAQLGGSDYSEAYLGLDANLNVLTWFITANFNIYNQRDEDLDASGVLLIPGTRLLVGGGKDGKLYLVDADNMGGFSSNSDACLQSFVAASGEIHSGPVAFNGPAGLLVYEWGIDDSLKAYQLVNGLFNTTPVWQSTVTAPDPAGQLWLSANGTSAGIVWATAPFNLSAAGATVPGILRAFDANTGVELYNSRQNVCRDDLGSFSKNPSPVVRDGMVYVPNNSGQLVVYGLNPPPPPPTPPPAAPTGLTATAGDSQVTLRWNASSDALSYNVRRRTARNPFRIVATVPALPFMAFTDLGLTNDTTYFYVVSAVGCGGESTNTPAVDATPFASSGVAADLSASFNRSFGLVVDGTMFTSGGFDGDGNALSENLLGEAVVFGPGTGFKLGPANGFDDVSCAGQTIALPPVQVNTLQILGAAVNGNQKSQSFVVNYTTGLPTTFTQSLSDWFTPQHFPGEAIAAAMPWRDRSDGSQDHRTFNLYAYTFNIDTNRTVSSIGVPVNRNVEIAAITLLDTSPDFTLSASPGNASLTQGGDGSTTIRVTSFYGFTNSVSLSVSGLPDGVTASFTPPSTTGTSALLLTASTSAELGPAPVTITGTSDGLTHTTRITVTVNAAVPGAVQAPLDAFFTSTNGRVTDGSVFSSTSGLDGGGSAYSADLLGSPASWNSTTFNLGPANGLDFVSSAGQAIALPAGNFSSLLMLATAVSGNQASQSFTVTYTDGTMATYTQGLSDWFTPQSFAGESMALQMAYRDRFNGTQDLRTFYLYGYAFALDNTKTVSSITLPSNSKVKVLAFTLLP